jgi:acyl-CoA reductase-like NAD-dependent aldehyde dehydrogenase
MEKDMTADQGSGQVCCATERVLVHEAVHGAFVEAVLAEADAVVRLATGQVVVNDSTCWWDINMPFGGAGGRNTGWGRIGGKHTLLGMTDLRTGAISL